MLYEHVCGKLYDTMYLIIVNIFYFARFQINCCLHPDEGNGRRNLQTETGLFFVMSVVCVSVDFVHKRYNLITRNS